MQTLDEVKRRCRMVGEGIAASVAGGEELSAMPWQYFG